ncbi:MAG: prohibitin family protein [Ruminococcaceae bacterium]|nr:prohibitin family protein [Oscillospiraceae bacterium]
MVGLVFGLIALVIGIGGGIIIRNNIRLKKFSVIAMVVGALLCIVCVFLGCIASVPTGHTGVVTTFGRVEKTTFDAGFNIKAPWQAVVKMDNRVQKANTLLSCFSSDIQEVTVSYTLNYQIDKANAQELYKTVGIAYYDTVIVPNIAEAVKVVTARYTAEELVSARAELAEAIEKVLTDNLSNYNIQVVSAAIEDMDFTDAFTNAVEAKQVAAQNKLQAEIEQAQKVMEQKAAAEMAVIQANAAAETSKIQAQAELEVTKIQADASEYAGQKEAAANDAIAKSLTEYLIKYYYIQEWDGKLPETYVGSDDVSTIINGITNAK